MRFNKGTKEVYQKRYQIATMNGKEAEENVWLVHKLSVCYSIMKNNNNYEQERETEYI